MSVSKWQQRTELLVGKEKLEKLRQSHVLVVGLGGVGGVAAEMICRAGIGRMTIIDGDSIHVSNINRQLAALTSTMGKMKAHVIGDRLMDINPALHLTVIDEYIRDERMVSILQNHYDYVVDAIDTLSPKIYLIHHSLQQGLRIVSSMGAGGKYDPTKLLIADISESYQCKLARILRKRLHKFGIHSGFKVVFSPEEVDPATVIPVEGEPNKRTTVGTISFMPAVFGCCCASVVINDLLAVK